VLNEPRSYPLLTIPRLHHAVEIVSDRVEAMIASAFGDGVAYSRRADFAEAESLQPRLHLDDIDVGERARLEVGIGDEGAHQHFVAEHLVVAESIHERRLLHEREPDIGEVARRDGLAAHVLPLGRRLRCGSWPAGGSARGGGSGTGGSAPAGIGTA